MASESGQFKNYLSSKILPSQYSHTTGNFKTIRPLYRGNNHIRRIRTTRIRSSYECSPIFSEVCFAHDSPRIEFTLVGTSVDTADILGIETALKRNCSGGVVGKVSCYESEVPRIKSQRRMTLCCTHTVNIILILKLYDAYHKVHRMLHGY